ncbi:MAG: ABC transporter substrate-binding protein, partial [Paracoccaceae bacterium]|nr:ABC transporter substrate-binding protein [Paracoccaceae bacterium]
MQNRPQSGALAAKRDRREMALKQWVVGSVIGVAALWAGSEVFADSHEVVIESHGYNDYGDLKYGPDAPYLDYVNPNAPLGGEISLSADGTFDSMNPFAT